MPNRRIPFRHDASRALVPECVLPDGKHPNKYIVCGEDLIFTEWSDPTYNTTYTELASGENHILIVPKNFYYIHIISVEPHGGPARLRCELNIQDLGDFDDHCIIFEEDDRMSQVVTKCEKQFEEDYYFNTDVLPTGYSEFSDPFETKQLGKLQKACQKKKIKLAACFVDLCR